MRRQQIPAEEAEDGERDGVGEQMGEVNVQKRGGKDGGQAEEAARMDAEHGAQDFAGQEIKDKPRPDQGEQGEQRIADGVVPEGCGIGEHLPESSRFGGILLRGTGAFEACGGRGGHVLRTLLIGIAHSMTMSAACVGGRASCASIF